MKSFAPILAMLVLVSSASAHTFKAYDGNNNAVAITEAEEGLELFDSDEFIEVEKKDNKKSSGEKNKKGGGDKKKHSHKKSNKKKSNKKSNKKKSSSSRSSKSSSSRSSRSSKSSSRSYRSYRSHKNMCNCNRRRSNKDTCQDIWNDVCAPFNLPTHSERRFCDHEINIYDCPKQYRNGEPKDEAANLRGNAAARVD